MENILLEDFIIELSSLHHQLNGILFKNELKPVKIAVENNVRKHKKLTLGHFSPREGWIDGQMQITIWTLALNGDVNNIIGILVHEMVHQFNYQNGIKDVENNQRHNKKFRDAALNYGLLSIKKTVRGENTNSHGMGFAFTFPSEKLIEIIDTKLDFNREALKLKHTYGIYRDQKKYRTTKRDAYMCPECELIIFCTQNNKSVNILCLNCNKRLIHKI